MRINLSRKVCDCIDSAETEKKNLPWFQQFVYNLSVFKSSWTLLLQRATLLC
jgi:hypothetical protein